MSKVHGKTIKSQPRIRIDRIERILIDFSLTTNILPYFTDLPTSPRQIKREKRALAGTVSHVL